MPKYFTVDCLGFQGMLVLLIVIFVGSTIRRRVKIFASHLVGLSFICHFFIHLAIISIDVCNLFLASSGFISCDMIAVSSAYIAMSDSCGVGISYIYILNSMGPRTDPCGTPV